MCNAVHYIRQETHCSHLQLDQHAFAAHTTRTPQVVDVFIFLIQLPGAHCFFTGTIITCKLSIGEQLRICLILISHHTLHKLIQ